MQFKSGDLVMVVRTVPGCTCVNKYLGHIFTLGKSMTAGAPVCGGCGVWLDGPTTLWVHPSFENHPVFGPAGFIEMQLKKIPPLEELQEIKTHIPAEV